MQQLRSMLEANDEASLAILRPLLMAARPGAQWAEDEMAEGALPSGEWWIVDPMEGNINYVQGMTDWSVTATLVQDNEAVITAVAVPLLSQTYCAMKGEGAFLNGERLHVSRKKEMGAALFATGQGSPGEDGKTQRRMGSPSPP